jgi:hypothetical protein
MGIETAIIAGLSVAVSAAAAASQASAANKASKLGQQTAAAQSQGLAAQAQMNRATGILAEADYGRTLSALNDAGIQNGLARSELALAGQELAARRAALESSARRLSTQTDLVLANADLAARGIALKRAEVSSAAVDAQATASAQAAASLGTLDAVAAETGLAGSTVTAFARQIAATEGTAVGSARRDAARAQAGLDLDAAQARNQTAASLMELQGRADELAVAAAQQNSAELQAVDQGIRLALQERAIGRDREKAANDLAGRQIGVAVQGQGLESQQTRLELSQQEADLRASMAVTSGVFGVIQSGLQIGGQYYAAQDRMAALKAGQLKIQSDARN